jgi:hypothetical protein
MKTQLPEGFKSLSDTELSDLLKNVSAEVTEIISKDDKDITDAEVDDLQLLEQAADAIEAEQGARVEAAEKRAEAIKNSRTRATKAEATEPVEPEAEAEVETEVETPTPTDEEEIVVPDDASELVEAEEKELVTASGVKAAKANQSQEVVIIQEHAPTAMVAAANIPGVPAGETLDFDGVVNAFSERSRGFKNRGGASAIEVFERFSVAKIKKPENEFEVDFTDQGGSFRTIMDAAKEARLPGGSLIASGGWCAPSETLYDFCSLETVTGILSLPEVTVRRGGINFTKGPDYGTLAASWGFLQTEAQAISGTAKSCYTITCPSFTDIRMDAIGFCVKNGILTNVGYPELTRRVLEIGAAAHAHKVNASVISRIGTYLGTAANFVEIGGAVADILDAINLQAVTIRYQYALDPNASLEVILPVWAKEVFRSDISRRNGGITQGDALAVTDAQVQAWFSARKLAVQWVYDFQPLTVTGTAVAWPTTVTAYIYPAGAFVKGTTDVIDLDTVYDSTGLSTNDYTAAFFEEGLLVANTCGGGRAVTITLDGGKGQTGAQSIGAGTGITF